MKNLKRGKIPDTFQPPNADFNIRETYIRLINHFKIDTKKYYLFDVEGIVKLFKVENEEFGRAFQIEANYYTIELSLSGNKIGDKTPLFLIRVDQNEIIQIYEQADGKSILKKYYKVNDKWEYCIVET